MVRHNFMYRSMLFLFFFFQAEDGIRDGRVTGVQTCALPILAHAVEIAREDGAQIRKKPAEIIDNSFADQLTKSGFLKELWGNELLPQEKRKIGRASCRERV